MKDAARSVGVKFSGRAFERAWHAAVQESGASAWSKPGAEIEAPYRYAKLIVSPF